MKGYLYIRTNEWCELKQVYKIGITNSIKDRNNTYITGEISRGYFIKIFELDVNSKQLQYIENIIKIKFKSLNVYIDAGREFYNKIIINKIDNFLNKNKFKLVEENELQRINRINNKNTFNKLVDKLLNNKIKPKPHQKRNY